MTFISPISLSGLIAGKMLENIDLSVDPCENFYDFACGGWMNKTIIPRDKNRFGMFDELERLTAVALRGKMKNIIL